MSFFNQLLDNLAREFDEQNSVSNYALEMLEHFLNALESGEIRTAQKIAKIWQVDGRVKKAILLAFRWGQTEKIDCGSLSFIDKANLWPRSFNLEDKVRIVPGSSTVRRGAYIGPQVTLMSPSYVNIGAFVGAGSMIDSHALVGSCAQVGEQVHVSAGVQIGGVLEPIGAVPVIIEDNCLIGGNCGIYEGSQVGEGAVLGAGLILTSSTKVFDLVNEKIISAGNENSLKIPPLAVVIPGARALGGEFAQAHGLSVSAPIIIKYRDAKTEQKIRLEDLLR